MAKTIQCSEVTLLQSRSRINKKHMRTKLATNDIATTPKDTVAPRQCPQEGNDVSRRHCRDRSLGFSPGALTRQRLPHLRPQEGNDTRRHRRRWRRSAGLSPGKTFATSGNTDRPQASRTRSGSCLRRNAATSRVSRHPLSSIHMAKKQGHHH